MAEEGKCILPAQDATSESMLYSPVPCFEDTDKPLCTSTISHCPSDEMFTNTLVHDTSHAEDEPALQHWSSNGRSSADCDQPNMPDSCPDSLCAELPSKSNETRLQSKQCNVEVANDQPAETTAISRVQNQTPGPCCTETGKHANVLLAAVHGFLNASQLVDVYVLCGGESIPAHRLVLASYSSCFCSQLISCEAGCSLSIDHLGIEPRCAKALIEFMYTGQLSDQTLSEEVLAAAKLLGIKLTTVNTGSSTVDRQQSKKASEVSTGGTEARLEPLEEEANKAQNVTNALTKRKRGRPPKKKSLVNNTNLGGIKRKKKLEAEMNAESVLIENPTGVKSELEDLAEWNIQNTPRNDGPLRNEHESDVDGHNNGNETGRSESLQQCKSWSQKKSEKHVKHVNKIKPRKRLSSRSTAKVKGQVTKKARDTGSCYQCCDCEFRARTRQNLHRHRAVKHATNTTSYTCKLCDKTFKLKKYLWDHEKSHREARLFPCEVCDASFKSNKYRLRHQRGHHSSGGKLTEEQSISCEECGKVFQSVSKCRVHKNAVHLKQRPYVCEQPGCGYAAADPSTLRQHKQCRHSGSRESILCEQCGRAFASRKSLSIHCQALHDDATFSCHLCDYAANFRTALVSHMKRMHGCSLDGQQVAPQFECSLCPFTSFTKYEFTRHQMKHEGEKPHKCPICDFATTEKGTLKKHMRHHTGETPFSCKECSKKFTSQSGLARHARTHTGVKPHVCDTCNKSYADKKSLDSHRYTHLNIKPYMCHMCTYSCVRKDILVNHICKSHGIDTQDLPAYLANRKATSKPDTSDVPQMTTTSIPCYERRVEQYNAKDDLLSAPSMDGGGKVITLPERGAAIVQSLEPEISMFSAGLSTLTEGGGAMIAQPCGNHGNLNTNMLSAALTYGMEATAEFGPPLFVIQK